jgi:hypothetical protein
MATIPNPVTHPLGAPVISGTEVTVDTYSKQPTRVTRLVADLTLQRFLLDRLFTSAGGVTGGAVLYDQVTENDLYATRDVEKVAPGAEFPIITSARLAPKIATVDKWGGKFDMTDEARDRNDIVAFTNHVRKVANTVVRKLNQYAVGVVSAAVTANSRTITGHSWSAAVPNGATPTAPASTPFGDLIMARHNAEVDELGIEYDTLLVNPNEEASLLYFAQFDSGQLTNTLAQIGITDYYASNRVTAGSPLLVASGQVGEFRIEQPLATETWREQEKQKTWWQTSVRPVAYVTNPFAILQINGVA